MWLAGKKNNRHSSTGMQTKQKWMKFKERHDLGLFILMKHTSDNDSFTFLHCGICKRQRPLCLSFANNVNKKPVFIFDELHISKYAYCSMSCNFHIQLHTLRWFSQSPGATATLECDLSQGLLHMLNKHEPNPPSATLVKGQSLYLHEQQIHLQSKPVLRIARLTNTT